MKEVEGSPTGGLFINAIDERVADARRIFNPHQPIADRNLFSGRVKQVNQAVTALRTPGKHPIVFGVRGVGKTSLANIIKLIAPIDDYMVSSHQCNAGSTFKSIMRNLLSGIVYNTGEKSIGFTTKKSSELASLADHLSPEFSQQDIIRLSERFGARILLIVDEFDRVRASERTEMSDMIKAASDSGGGNIKILVVGVGETLDDLIKDHPSIERNISEVQMSLMSSPEIREIVRKGSSELGMSFADAVVERIVDCAQGFPYFTHLLSQHASISAISNGRQVVTEVDFMDGLRQSIEEVDHSIKKSYRDAVHSNRPTQFADVLYAAALANCDEFGFFTAKDLTNVPAKMDGGQFTLQGIQYPLSKLTTRERGEILRKEGQAKRFQYKFSNPMMKQYVIMRRMAAAEPA